VTGNAGRTLETRKLSMIVCLFLRFFYWNNLRNEESPMKYELLVKEIVEAVGGKENILNVSHCITRLRFRLVDGKKFDSNKIKGLSGVLGTTVANNQYQVIIGNQVDEVYKEMADYLGISKENKAEKNSQNRFSIKEAINVVASLFTPLVPALAGSGIIKGLLVLFTNFGLIVSTSGGYQILSAAADSVFYFMPIILAYSCAKKFNANIIVSMAIGGSLIYPSLVTFMTEANSVDFFSIPVIVTTYASSVVPIVLAILAYSKLEQLLNKFIPKTLELVITPAISLAVMVPATLIIFGPFGNYVSNLLGQLFVNVTEFSPLLSGAIFGGAYPIFVMFGVHRALVPIGINEVATLGSTSLWAFTGPSNFAQSGAALGSAFKIKDKEMKSVALTAALSAAFGITEPALYGVNLKYKRPMISVVAAGAIGGAIAGIGGAKAYAVAIPSLLTIPAFIGAGFAAFLIGISVAFVAGFILTMILGIDEEKKENNQMEEIAGGGESSIIKDKLLAPIEGKMYPIEQGSDQAFASKAMGDGVMIIPEKGVLKSPVNGRISALFPTNHAIGILSDSGSEILIHIGIDTVELKGKFFDAKVKQGDQVKMGQELILFDIDQIEKAGFKTETFIVITNTSNYLEVVGNDTDTSKFGETIISLI
jgi:PTS system beta-glucosides-specific IIC component